MESGPMTSAHLSEQDLIRCRQRTLPATEILATYQHLAACRHCYEKLGVEFRLGEAVAAAQAEMLQADGAACAWFDYGAFTAFVAEELRGQERDLLATHLEICPECAAAVLAILAVWPATASLPARLSILKQ